MSEAIVDREMKGLELFISRFKIWRTRMRRRFIPYVIWHGSDVYVRIQFDRTAEVWEGLRPVEDGLGKIGVRFDRGSGFGKRDWEWDWSLSGPVQVKLVGTKNTDKNDV